MTKFIRANRRIKRYGCIPLALLLLSLGTAHAASESCYFRLSAPSSTVLTVTGSEGWLAWSNAAPGTTTRIQRASTMLQGGDWNEYARVISTNDSVIHRVYDAHPPSGMQFIPAGTFIMGATTNMGHAGYGMEMPRHTVTLDAFYMGETEVTKREWDEIYAWATNNGYAFGAGAAKGEDHPVHSVSWYDVTLWCNAKSEKEGLTPCYWTTGTVWRTGACINPDSDWTANGYRLPTEAEWEYAARGGIENRRFPWGDTISQEQANYYSYWSGGRPYYDYDVSSTNRHHPLYSIGSPYTTPYTAPVKSFPPNAYGLYEVSGNVTEWCWDWFADDYYSRSPTNNPLGTSYESLATNHYPWASLNRVFRGGSWDGTPDYSRLSYRFRWSPASAGYTMGFRVAKKAF